LKKIATPFRIDSLLAAALLVCAMPALAIDGGSGKVKDSEESAPKEEIAYKFTPSFYRTTNVTPAYDLNLRRDNGGQMTWIGFYQRSNEFQQLRLGYENTWALPYVKVTPSLQYATRGFLGGSLTGEIGERYFALVGFGRTNLKDYFNLNFDPNDMVMLGVGTRALPNTTLSLFQIRDDRLGTGQRISHLVTRIKSDEKNRWTVDVFYKEGRGDADPASAYVHGTGVTLTWDHERYFARVASDPYVNFSNNHMVRVAAGFRF
jgi:hypothetical protein